MITKYPKNDKRGVARETLDKEEEAALIQVTFHNAIEEFSNKKKELNISEKVFNKSLDEINIEKDKLDAVMNPIESSHGLPNECYTHKDYMAFERNKL